MARLFARVALIGLGLMGSSISHAMRRAGLAGHIAGYSRRAETRAKAQELGLVDSVHETAAEAVAGADLVIVGVPVGASGAVAEAIAPALSPGAIVSEVGSVKQAVIEQMAPHIPEGVHFVPAHPIAGTEESGPGAGFAELFDNRWCVLVPLAGTDEDAVARVEAFWRACGANVERMSAAHHDLVFAITSHVPHLIAYNIVGTVAHLEEVTESEVIKFAAAGFRDFTRIAASDPVMWRDIFLNNRDAVLEMLGRFNEDLYVLQRAIRFGDGETLEALFTRTRAIRRGVIEAGQDAPYPDFGRPHDGPARGTTSQNRAGKSKSRKGP